MGDQIRIPRVEITSVFFLLSFFFPFSPFPFQGDIKAWRTPALCYVVSPTCIYHQFVRHLQYHLQYHVNKQWNTSVEFASILLIVDRLKI